jgi:protoporphyrinogen oxidase
MINVRYCILGGGPSGLAFAHALRSRGITSFVVLEKETNAGGLCRSEMVDGSPLDIGGGHFLDPRRRNVLELLFRFMPESEWRRHTRIAKVRIRGTEADHPLEGNLWQLGIDDQVDFLQSICAAGCANGLPMPDDFVSWIRWKLGDRIAEEYMLPYNRKMWGGHLDVLGTYWLHKLPAVSFRDTLRSCITRKALGSLPAHAEFYYPKRHGYGEVWRRMAADLGNQFMAGFKLSAIDLKNRRVNGDLSYDTLVTSIPWQELCRCADVPAGVSQAIMELLYTSVNVDYVPERSKTSAHWTYDPDETVPFHRMLHRDNFCLGARGYWTETNASRARSTQNFRHTNEYAYPINTRRKPAALERIFAWAAASQILPLGRWGRWEHMNSDVAVDLAMKEASNA